MYDLIGDIHGHADELERLLQKLGYQQVNAVYRHPERQVIFLGDFIDRGPKIRETLSIVRPMVEQGHALAVMGNHELNALAYHTEDPLSPGEYLRVRNDKHKHQHAETMRQLSHEELHDHLNWFRTLPMWLDLDGLRVVHACWDAKAIERLASVTQEYSCLDDEFLLEACKESGSLYDQVELVLKGKEAKLPEGKLFHDKDGHERTDIRTRWYLPALGKTYGGYAFQSDPVECDLPLDEKVVAEAMPYPEDAKPVFIGHYWQVALRPKILTSNVACLDYSVAKGGFLCAYQWQGERSLSNEHFVRVP
jgi:hypothetical protein